MKIITSFLFVSALVIFNFSCKKEQEESITKVIEVSLAPGETYSARVVQAGDEDDILKITSQASHAQVSEIAAISGSKDVMFTYTPVSQFTGTDEVQISSTEGEHHGNGGGHGNCSGHQHQDENTVYVYKITINGNNH
ncbi:hypothetical protein BH11BAC1_BH11BAC1_15620 [soil metagenome]